MTTEATYHAETYWPERYRRQGETYVARGGRRESFDAQMEALVPYLDHLPTEGRVLDFGCGPGRFRPHLEARGLEYEGVDIIPGLGTMDVEDVEPASFEAAVAIFVLQHIVDMPEYREVVDLLHGSLRAGGTLLVVDHEWMPEEQRPAHMRPIGFGAICDHWLWYDAAEVGEYNGHWIGVFVR